MDYANDKNGKRIHASMAVRTEEYFCPFCGAKLILRDGAELKKHFAHPEGSHDCELLQDEWKSPECAWKSDWLSLLSPERCNMLIKSKGARHVADYCDEYSVYIFQKGLVKPEEFRKKSAFFEKAGYSVIWVFDGRSFELTPHKEKPGIYRC